MIPISIITTRTAKIRKNNRIKGMVRGKKYIPIPPLGEESSGCRIPLKSQVP
jgi:hypothetical protein